MNTSITHNYKGEMLDLQILIHYSLLLITFKNRLYDLVKSE